MDELKNLEPNVFKFLQKSALEYGKFKSHELVENMDMQISDRGIRSPIEKLFYIAFCVMAESRYIELNPGPAGIDDKLISGIYIYPQMKIWKYIVDFLIQSLNHRGAVSESVVVELDGHDFHDKDKKQRAYEKSRDRFLVSKGHKVLHFTGSEVNKDPYAIADEVLSIIDNCGNSEKYNPTNPLGIS